MELDKLLDFQHGPTGVIVSVIAILFIQLFIKAVDFYFKHILKKESKRDLDMKRAFKALRLIAGDKWATVREELMKDEKID
jgi:hypothetical protein